MDGAAPKTKFLARAWALVNATDMSHVISWTDDGKSFVIYDVSVNRVHVVFSF
jgi:hypothetical protein